MSDGSLSLFRYLLVVVCVVLLVAVASATPCPALGDPSLALLNGTLYTFSNCANPVDASGTNVINVSMTFLNSSVGSIVLSLGFVQNFTLSVVDSSFTRAAGGGATMVTVLAVKISNVRIEVLRSNVSSTFAGQMIYFNPTMSASDITISLVASTVVITATAGHFIFFSNGTATCIWANVSIVLVQSNIILDNSSSNVAQLLTWAAVDILTNLTFVTCCGTRIVAGKLAYIGLLGPTRAVDGLLFALHETSLAMSTNVIDVGAGLDIMSNLSISIARADLTAGGRLLNFFGFLGTTRLLDGLSLALKDAYVRVETFVVYFFNPTGTCSSVDVQIANTTIRAGQVLSFPLDTGTGVGGSVTNVSLSVLNDSYITIKEWGSLLGAQCTGEMSYLSVLLVSSTVISLNTIVSLANASTLAHVDMTISNSRVNATLAIFSIFAVQSIDGSVMFATRNGSRLFLTLSKTSSSGHFSIRGVGALRALALVFVVDSFVVLSVASALYSLALAQVSNVTMMALSSTDGTTIGMTIRNSSIVLEQLAAGTNVVDVCVAFPFTAVDLVGISSAEIVSIVVEDHSLVSLSCEATVSAVSFQAVPRLSFQLVVSSGSRIILTTRATTQRSTSTKMVSGSFLVLFVNSLVTKSHVLVESSSVVCGLVCQLVGTEWNDGFFYSIFVGSLLGYIPQVTMPRFLNSTVVLRNSTISGSASALPLRPVFSLTNATNVTVIVEGPVEADLGGYDGLIRTGNGSLNRLELLNCEMISLRSASGGSPMTLDQALLAPGTGWGDVVVQSSRAHGVGSCGLSSTQSLQLASSSASHTPSTTVSATATADVFVAPAHHTLSFVQQAAGAAVCSVAFVASPAIGMSLQVTRAQRLVYACQAESEGGVDEQLDVASSPTQLNIGRTNGSYNRGAVLGNTLILVMIGIAAGGAFVFVPGVTAEKLCLPGILYVPIATWIIPTISSATALLALDDADILDVVIALVGCTAFLTPMALLVMITTTRWFGARAALVPLRPRRGTSGLQNLLNVWYNRSVEHVDKIMMPGFLSRWDYAGIADYMPHRQWFGCCVEASCSVITAVLAGLSALLRRRHQCSISQVLQAVLSIGFLVTLGLTRPQNVRADRWSALSSSFLQSTVAILGLVGRDASSTLSVVQLVLSIVYIAGYVSWGIAPSSTRFMRLLIRRSRRGSTLKSRQRALELTHAEIASLRNVGDQQAALRIIIGIICLDGSS